MIRWMGRKHETRQLITHCWRHTIDFKSELYLSVSALASRRKELNFVSICLCFASNVVNVPSYHQSNSAEKNKTKSCTKAMMTTTRKSNCTRKHTNNNTHRKMTPSTAPCTINIQHQLTKVTWCYQHAATSEAEPFAKNNQSNEKETDDMQTMSQQKNGCTWCEHIERTKKERSSHASRTVGMSGALHWSFVK